MCIIVNPNMCTSNGGARLYSIRREREEAQVTDRYTKIVLTVIAGALCILIAQNSTGRALAVGPGECGNSDVTPCFVRVKGAVEVYGGGGGMDVVVKNWP